MNMVILFWTHNILLDLHLLCFHRYTTYSQVVKTEKFMISNYSFFLVSSFTCWHCSCYNRYSNSNPTHYFNYTTCLNQAACSDCRGLKHTLHSGEVRTLQQSQWDSRLIYEPEPSPAKPSGPRHGTMIESPIQANVPTTHSPHNGRPEITRFCFDIAGSRTKSTAWHLQSNSSTQDTESTVLGKWRLNSDARKFLTPHPPTHEPNQHSFN